jgi:hypothetical protein
MFKVSSTNVVDGDTAAPLLVYDKGAATAATARPS